MKTKEAGSVSEVFQFENSYVVAYLTKEYEEGTTELEDIKEQISALVIKEKKANKITDSITATNDLASIASSNSTTVVSAQKATMANLSVQGIGYEPELVGSIFGTDMNSISAPITGNNAVYVVEVTAIDDEKLEGNFSQQKTNIVNQASSAANGQSYNALKEDANVIDNRSDFY